MEIVLYIICFIVLIRYCFVLYKYLKTGEFKKKVYKGNIIGVIAYSFLTVLIICFLILMSLVSKDKSSDLVMWIIFASGFGTVVMYLWSWQQRVYDNARTKKSEVAKIMNEEFNNKYGNEEYEEFKVEHFNIEDNVVIDERSNYLISLITNNHISFIHQISIKILQMYSQVYINKIILNY